MSISKSLIDKFAKIINSGKEPEKEVYFYGEVKMDGDVKCVQLDGSNTLTPCEETADSQPGTGGNPGDRVLVLIKNHTATIIGNATNPSLARILANGAQNTADGAASAAAAAQTAANNAAKTATDYITQNQNGSLEIGNSGSGSKNVLSSDGQRIYRKDGNADQLLAEFLANKITLNDAEISKNQGESTLWVKNTAGPIGITNGASGVSSYVNVLNNEVLVQHGGVDNGFTFSGMLEVLRNKILLTVTKMISLGNYKYKSLEILDDKVIIRTKETQYNLATSQNDTVSESVEQVCTDATSLFITGTVDITCDGVNNDINASGTSYVTVSSTTVNANGYIRFDMTPDVTSGYTIVGLSRIQSNHTNAMQLTSYWINGNTIYVWFHNSGSSAFTDARLQLTWFAVKSSNLN